MWAAKQGLDALTVTWDEGSNAKVSSPQIWDELRAASEKDGVVAKSEGDVAQGLAAGERHRGGLRAAVPRPCHDGATELHGAAARPDACEIWVGTQVQSRGRSNTAPRLTGVPLEKVTVNNHYIGGGFGRRLEPDMVEKAVRVAKQSMASRSRWCGDARKTSSTTSTGRSIAT